MPDISHDSNAKRHASDAELADEVRSRLRESRTVQKLFDMFGVDISRIDSLKITIRDLENEYAKTDDKEMVLDKSLFTSGRFFRDFSFLPVHEIVHFLTRVKEREAFFNDPEETLGFVAAVAHLLSDGASEAEAWKKVYPNVAWHFHDEEDARLFFRRCLRRARDFM